MTASDLRERARRFDARTRRWNALGILLVLLLLADSGLEIWRDADPLNKAGNVAMIAAVVYIAFEYRRHRLAAAPDALGRTGSAEFFRDELIRQRNLSQDGWGYILPFVPGLGLIIASRAVENRTPGEVAALTALAGGVFLLIAWMNARTVRKLQKEIDALDGA